MATAPEWTFLPNMSPDGQKVRSDVFQLAEGIYFNEWADVAAIPSDDSKYPVVWLRLEVQDGRPVCTRLSFWQPTPRDRAKGSTMSAKIIGSVRIGELIEQAIEWQGIQSRMFVNVIGASLDLPGYRYEVESDGRIRLPADDEHRASQGAAHIGRRRQITDEVLSDVADAYLGGGSRPTQAVADALPTSHRNASRLIATARERGLIPPYERSKNSAIETGGT